MKRLFYLMLVVLGTAAFTACSDDDDNNNGGGNDEPIQTPVYHYGEITIIKNGGNNFSGDIYTFNVGDTITIDYGDGYVQKTVVNGTDEKYDKGNWIKRGNTNFDYTYSDRKEHTITIKGNISGLNCSDNQLTSLDISNCTALTTLSCNGNELTSLDVTKNSALTNLSCTVNQLTSLDVTNCTALTYLDCQYNQLTSLNVSKNIALTSLYCFGNQFTAAEMNKIYEALPNVGYDETGAPQGDLTCDKLGNPSIAEQKGWDVTHY